MPWMRFSESFCVCFLLEFKCWNRFRDLERCKACQPKCWGISVAHFQKIKGQPELELLWYYRRLTSPDKGSGKMVCAQSRRSGIVWSPEMKPVPVLTHSVNLHGSYFYRGPLEPHFQPDSWQFLNPSTARKQGNSFLLTCIDSVYPVLFPISQVHEWHAQRYDAISEIFHKRWVVSKWFFGIVTRQASHSESPLAFCASFSLVLGR